MFFRKASEGGRVTGVKKALGCFAVLVALCALLAAFDCEQQRQHIVYDVRAKADNVRVLLHNELQLTSDEQRIYYETGSYPDEALARDGEKLVPLDDRRMRQSLSELAQALDESRLIFGFVPMASDAAEATESLLKSDSPKMTRRDLMLFDSSLMSVVIRLSDGIGYSQPAGSLSLFDAIAAVDAFDQSAQAWGCVFVG